MATTRARPTTTEERGGAAAPSPEDTRKTGAVAPEQSGGLTGAFLRTARAVGEVMTAPVADSLLGRRPRSTAIVVDERVEQDALVVEAELPGFALDDITVAAEGGKLLLRAEREPRHGAAALRRRERRTGTLSRELALPPHTDPATITATYADGLLSVRVPLPAPPTSPERVEIPVRS